MRDERLFKFSVNNRALNIAELRCLCNGGRKKEKIRAITNRLLRHDGVRYRTCKLPFELLSEDKLMCILCSTLLFKSLNLYFHI